LRCLATSMMARRRSSYSGSPGPCRAAQQQGHVGVLLDRAGVAQVGELGPVGLIAALFGRAAELAEHDHRQVQLFGHGLDLAGNLEVSIWRPCLENSRQLQSWR